MGSAHRIQLDGGVRYVSPAAAHLFTARAASGGVPNLSSSEADWRYFQQQQQQQQQGFGQGEGYQASDGGESRQQQQGIEIERLSPPSPVASVEGVTSPQAYLEAILLERGYDSTPRSSASDGCRCTPTQKQLDDYQ
ncbi:unnamed protein product, partial [Ectocarpus sp. 12 AP-2014]